MKQFRFSGKGAKLVNKKFSVVKELEFTYDDILSNIDFENTLNVIKILDEKCEDWGMTESILEHFIKVFIDGYKCIPKIPTEDDSLIGEKTEKLLKTLVHLVNTKEKR